MTPTNKPLQHGSSVASFGPTTPMGKETLLERHLPSWEVLSPSQSHTSCIHKLFLQTQALVTGPPLRAPIRGPFTRLHIALENGCVAFANTDSSLHMFSWAVSPEADLKQVTVPCGWVCRPPRQTAPSAWLPQSAHHHRYSGPAC